MPRPRPSRALRVPFAPVVDGAPHRPWGSVNMRFEDKRRFDLLHAWLAKEHGRALAQWDVCSIVLSSFVATAGDSLPPELRRLLS